MNTTQQPEALVFADSRPTSTSDDLYQWAIDAEDLILAQHARIEELEALLSAIGAGGVEPLRKQASTADVADERDAFDKWLRIKPCGAAHDFGWQAWKARAALASTPVAGELATQLATLQAGLQAAAPNAPLYDPREVAFSAQAAVPVAGQSRFKGEKDWHWCSPEHVAMVAATPSEWQGYEARYLYAHAAPAHPAEGVPAQIETLRAELAEETEAAENWRRLALQFDNHRMQAIGHLKAVTNPAACFDKYKAAKAFLSAPPLGGEEVLAQRLAALAAKAKRGERP